MAFTKEHACQQQFHVSTTRYLLAAGRRRRKITALFVGIVVFLPIAFHWLRLTVHRTKRDRETVEVLKYRRAIDFARTGRDKSSD